MGSILSPEVKLRQDGGRAILFTVNMMNDEYVFKFLYPQHAMILALFDGKSDIEEITETVAYVFNIDIGTAKQEIEALLNLPLSTEKTIRSFIVDASVIDSKKIRLYDPGEFIVPADKIDMSSTRCAMPCAMVVLPTMRCATNCIYCYADRRGMQGQSEFDLQFYKRLLSEARECGIETLEISGGDLFCREDAFDLIQYTLDEGMDMIIPTKYPLSREQVNCLARIGLSSIQISIDALLPDVIDKMVARHGYGNKILKTLDFLGEAGIQVRTNTVLTPYNIKNAVSLGHYLAQMPHVFMCKFTPYGRSIYNHHDSLFCSPNEFKEFERELSQIQAEFPHKSLSLGGIPSDPYSGDENERSSVFWNRPLCTANKRAVIILPNGKVTICEQLYFNEYFVIGDLTKQTLKEVWNSPRALELSHPDQSKVPDGACKDCPDFTRCHEGLGRCFRNTLEAYGIDKPHWPDPSCPRAPVGNRMVY